MKSGQDHPRIRGEHMSAPASKSFGAGSSPHPRGTPAVVDSDGGGSRIIPASAGNTRNGSRTNKGKKDHPRIRGEHRSVKTNCKSRRGSSPHPRGTPLYGLSVERWLRIIPASAGNTWGAALLYRTVKDHPRIRGEHSKFCFISSSEMGSSPHPRGTPFTCKDIGKFRGIIPASAGNTIHTSAHIYRLWDHPRIRGEHTGTDMVITSVVGSSPHPRGTRKCICTLFQSNRIIPASAGNTVVASSFSQTGKDHPRIRGEHRLPVLRCYLRLGSSPHPRGTPDWRAFLDSKHGIIPASAGNTIYEIKK